MRSPKLVDVVVVVIVFVVVVVIVVVVVVVLLKFLFSDAGVVFDVRWFWFGWEMPAFRQPHVVVKVRYVESSDRSHEWIGVWVFRKVFEEPGVVAGVQDQVNVVLFVVAVVVFLFTFPVFLRCRCAPRLDTRDAPFGNRR